MREFRTSEQDPYFWAWTSGTDRNCPKVTSLKDVSRCDANSTRA